VTQTLQGVTAAEFDSAAQLSFRIALAEGGSNVLNIRHEDIVIGTVTQTGRRRLAAGSTLEVEFKIGFVAESVCGPSAAASCSSGGGVAADTYVRTVVNSASFATALGTYLSANAPSAVMRSAAVTASVTPDAYNQVSYRSVSPSEQPTAQPSTQPTSPPTAEALSKEAEDQGVGVILIVYFVVGAVVLLLIAGGCGVYFFKKRSSGAEDKPRELAMVVPISEYKPVPPLSGNVPMVSGTEVAVDEDAYGTI
tara:strand:- start:49 stop:804 length:756 start_codon:yes stop_codon:yes gene_type:complete